MSAPVRAPGDEPPTDAPTPEASPPAPRPLIRPALRPSGTPSAPRPVVNPAARGITPSARLEGRASSFDSDVPPGAPLAQARDEASEETTRPGARHPTADLTERVAPPLPVMPGVGDEGDVAPFTHTVRGFTRGQVEQAASRPSAPPQPKPIAGVPPKALAEPFAAVLDPRQREIRRGPDVRPPDPTITVMRPSAPSILPTASVTALVLLCSAIVLPTAGGPPWELLARPAEVTLQALAAFILIGVVHLLPVRERTRATWGVIASTVLLGFAFVAWRVATTRGAFDAQPALDALFASPLPNPGWPELLALVGLPAALFARAQGSRWPAWILGGLGVVAAFVTFVWMSPGALFASLDEAAFLGDRIGAFATLPLLAAMVIAPVALVPRLRRFATGAGFGFWALALAPLAIFALFAAKSDQWLHVLEPLKLVLFLAAITLYAAAAVATLATPSSAQTERPRW